MGTDTQIVTIPTEKLAELVVRKLESSSDPTVYSLDSLVDLTEGVFKQEGIGFTRQVTRGVLNFLHANGFLKFRRFNDGYSEKIEPWFVFTPVTYRKSGKSAEENNDGTKSRVGYIPDRTDQ